MSFDTISIWPSWAYISEDEVDELLSAIATSQGYRYQIPWFAEAIFTVKMLPRSETPQFLLQCAEHPVSADGLNNEQAHDKALLQWWLIQGNTTKEDRKSIIDLLNKWHRTMMVIRPSLRMREIGVRFKKYVDKHGLVDGASAMAASPLIGKMETIFLQVFLCEELWNESQRWISMYRIAEAQSAPIA